MAARRGTKKTGKGRKDKPGPYQHSADNARLVLTDCPARTAIPTRDPFDRAHVTPDGLGLLLPAGLRDRGRPDRPNPLVTGRPRRYHASQAHALRTDEHGHTTCLGADSVFDGWWETVCTLHAAGITLFGQGPTLAETLYDLAERETDRVRVRDLVRPRRRAERLAEQAVLEREQARLEGRLRDRLHQKTTQMMTNAERRLEAMANEILHHG